MKIAVQIQPQHANYAQIREAAVEAEELGVDSIYNWDHFFPLYGDPDGAHFEAWTMLASLAEVTSQVDIGCLVTCNSYRNPQLLADMARTVDHISDGRLLMGIGSGWFERDYEEFGYEFGTAGSRLLALRDDLPKLIDRMAKGNPAPSRRIPILIGGGGEKKTLNYVSQFADSWHTWWNDVWEHKNSVLKDWCERNDRDGAEIARSVGVDPDKVEDWDELFAGLSAAEVDEVTIGRSGPDYDLTVVKRFVEWRDSL